MYTVSFDWQDPITLIQVPFTHHFGSYPEVRHFLNAIVYNALYNNQQYSHLTIKH